MSKEKMRLFSLLAISEILAGTIAHHVNENTNTNKKATKEEINKANGLREFIINDKSYWAINYKNALKKSKKL